MTVFKTLKDLSTPSDFGRAFTHTMGGLEINEKAQVLNVKGEPISGLYAAGEATGGVHGMVRPGTVAVADCIIFGRIAARTANAWGGC